MYKMYVKVCMSHAYFSSSELLIFFNDASKKIYSNQQIRGDGTVCHNLDLSSISLTRCWNWKGEDYKQILC